MQNNPRSSLTAAQELKKTPDDVNLLLQASAVTQAMGMYRTASEQLERCARLSAPNDPDVVAAFVVELSNESHVDAAIAALLDAIAEKL